MGRTGIETGIDKGDGVGFVLFENIKNDSFWKNDGSYRLLLSLKSTTRIDKCRHY